MSCRTCEIDTRTHYEKNKILLQTSPVYANAAGEYTLEQVDVLLANFQNGMVQQIENSALDVIINRFGEEAFNKSVNEITSFIESSDLTGYPELEERINSPIPISNAEIADFYDSNIYTPSKVTNSIQTKPDKFKEELNCFFMGSAITKIMGGFCNTLKNIYGTGAAFFGAIGAAVSLINNALDAITKLKNMKNPLEAAFEKIKVQALIESMKELIVNAIKAHLACVISAVQNFEKLFDDIGRVSSNAVRRARDLKDKVSETFSEENQETLIKKIEGTIDYAVNRFANPGLKEIEALMYRMCGMASGLEELITAAKEPLDRFAEKVVLVNDRLKEGSSEATAQAVENGAIRHTEETQEEQINTIVEKCQEAAAKAVAETDPEDLDPPAVNSPGLDPDTEALISEWEKIWNGQDERFKFGYGLGPNRMGSAGWYMTEPDARAKLIKLQEKFGKRLTINSAYRSKKYNGTRKNAAKGSLHMSGKAFDITWSGFNTESMNKVAALAREVGFTGIGYYNPDSDGNYFLHVDTGRKRYWIG